MCTTTVNSNIMAHDWGCKLSDTTGQRRRRQQTKRIIHVGPSFSFYYHTRIIIRIVVPEI